MDYVAIIGQIEKSITATRDEWCDLMDTNADWSDLNKLDGKIEGMFHVWDILLKERKKCLTNNR